MPRKPHIKYEKPVSIDMGRVAPILGDRCSVGNGAEDCPQGFNNGSIPTCNPGGTGATGVCTQGSTAGGNCETGSGAAMMCYPSGSAATVFCLTGGGYGV